MTRPVRVWREGDVPPAARVLPIATALACGEARPLAEALRARAPDRDEIFTWGDVPPAGAGPAEARRAIARVIVSLSLPGVPLLPAAALEAPAAARALAATAHPGFDPFARCTFPDAGPALFVVVRDGATPDQPPLVVQRSRVVCVVNVSGGDELLSLDWRALLGTRNAIRDLLTGVRFNVHGPSVGLAGYQALWATV